MAALLQHAKQGVLGFVVSLLLHVEKLSAGRLVITVMSESSCSWLVPMAVVQRGAASSHAARAASHLRSYATQEVCWMRHAPAT
jgi:hypothetical protein